MHSNLNLYLGLWFWCQKRPPVTLVVATTEPRSDVAVHENSPTASAPKLEAIWNSSIEARWKIENWFTTKRNLRCYQKVGNYKGILKLLSKSWLCKMNLKCVLVPFQVMHKARLVFPQLLEEKRLTFRVLCLDITFRSLDQVTTAVGLDWTLHLEAFAWKHLRTRHQLECNNT